MKYFPFANYRFELISRITFFSFCFFLENYRKPSQRQWQNDFNVFHWLKRKRNIFPISETVRVIMSTNCRPNQNIMKKIRKKPNWQIKLKCAGCEEMCNDNFSVYTCYITYCCICWAIDKQLYLYLIAMGHIEGLFVSWKLRLAREWRCHTFLYLSSSLVVWTNAGGNFLTMFDKLTVLQEATIQK